MVGKCKDAFTFTMQNINKNNIGSQILASYLNDFITDPSMPTTQRIAVNSL